MMFEAYLTNVALYATRGVEVGEYLKFPATTEEIQALLSRIEIDGKKYSEIFIISLPIYGPILTMRHTDAISPSTKAAVLRRVVMCPPLPLYLPSIITE